MYEPENPFGQVTLSLLLLAGIIVLQLQQCGVG